ncbi:MAG: hypothetical protein AAB459_04085 [Patescibacteria group bacterium]
MNTIDEDREVNLRERVPNWIKVVNDAKQKNVDYIIVMMDAFVDNPKLLFDSLWYAQNVGVSVLVGSPNEQTTDRNDPPKVMIYLREPSQKPNNKES